MQNALHYHPGVVVRCMIYNDFLVYLEFWQRRAAFDMIRTSLKGIDRARQIDCRVLIGCPSEQDGFVVTACECLPCCCVVSVHKKRKKSLAKIRPSLPYA